MKEGQNNKKRFLLFIFLIMVLTASAQKTFKYQAGLNNLTSTGFYKISLSPDIVSKSKDDLSDIRIMAGNGHFIPYVSQGNFPEIGKEKFIAFPEVKNSNIDTGTSFIVNNINKKPINTLWAKLRNTAVMRTINISGSDDLKTWYAIEENIPLQEYVSNSDGTSLQSLSFPASNYHYFKLLVNDRNRTPIRIIEVGEYISTQSQVISYLPVSFNSFQKKDINESTDITIKLNDSYLVNRLHLGISGPSYYKREVSIFQVDKTGKHLLADLYLNSNKKEDFFISAKADMLQLKINNGDNLPLEINDLKIYQAEHYIISYLTKDSVYKLLTGDISAKEPEYDLKFFADSIRDVKPAILGQIMKNSDYQRYTPTPKVNRAILIWIAIIIALTLLSLLTWKMAAEVNKKTADD